MSILRIFSFVLAIMAAYYYTDGDDRAGAAIASAILFGVWGIRE